MKLVKTILLILATVLPASLSASLSAQGPPPPPPGAGPPMQRPGPGHDALEAQILGRFVNAASREMALDATQKARLGEVVRTSAKSRKALNQRANQLNRRMQASIRDQATSADAFNKLLADHAQLRRDEQQIADTEQTELARFLTPRQQAHFLMLWIRLQENARRIQAQVPIGR